MRPELLNEELTQNMSKQTAMLFSIRDSEMPVDLNVKEKKAGGFNKLRKFQLQGSMYRWGKNATTVWSQSGITQASSFSRAYRLVIRKQWNSKISIFWSSATYDKQPVIIHKRV